MPTFDPSEAQYYAAHMPHIDNPGFFRHTPPADKPSAPAFPDTLSGAEQAEVNAWLADQTVPLSLAAAIAKADEYTDYWETLTVWNDADEMEKITQFRHALARAMAANTATVPVSSSLGQTGSGAVHPVFDP